jgi:hypothetical protein
MCVHDVLSDYSLTNGWSATFKTSLMLTSDTITNRQHEDAKHCYARQLCELAYRAMEVLAIKVFISMGGGFYQSNNFSPQTCTITYGSLAS